MSVVRSWLVVATAAAACWLSVVSRCRLSVADCRSLARSFFIVRCPLTFVASFWLCLQGRAPRPQLVWGSGNQCTYKCIHCTHTEHVYVQPICCSSVKYCTCNHATVQLFSCATVQLCNCATVQLSNCSTVQLVERFPAWKARATTSAAVETSSTPHLLQWHHLHFPQHLHPRHANLPQTQNECGISLFARLPGKYFALILAHRET